MGEGGNFRGPGGLSCRVACFCQDQPGLGNLRFRASGLKPCGSRIQGSGHISFAFPLARFGIGVEA